MNVRISVKGAVDSAYRIQFVASTEVTWKTHDYPISVFVSNILSIRLPDDNHGCMCAWWFELNTYRTESCRVAPHRSVVAAFHFTVAPNIGSQANGLFGLFYNGIVPMCIKLYCNRCHERNFNWWIKMMFQCCMFRLNLHELYTLQPRASERKLVQRIHTLTVKLLIYSPR